MLGGDLRRLPRCSTELSIPLPTHHPPPTWCLDGRLTCAGPARAERPASAPTATPIEMRLPPGPLRGRTHPNTPRAKPAPAAPASSPPRPRLLARLHATRGSLRKLLVEGMRGRKEAERLLRRWRHRPSRGCLARRRSERASIGSL